MINDGEKIVKRSLSIIYGKKMSIRQFIVGKEEYVKERFPSGI